MSTPEISSAASRLCAACGMCCNGVLFDIVRLQAGESPKAFAALGLKVKRRPGESHCVQPCAAHRDSQCAIYSARPERCRIFECRQLQRVASGEITEAQALENIGEALQLAVEVNALLLRAGGSNLNRPLTHRCETAMAGPGDPATAEARRQLARAKEKLDALLAQEFRIDPAAPAGAASAHIP